MHDSMTMGAIARRSAQQYPNRTAMIFGEERITYLEYNKRCNRAAHTLENLGVKKGDHVAILGKNSIQYLELCHGAAKVGVVFGTINWRLTPQEISFIVQDADNLVLFVEAGFQELVGKFQDELSNVKLVVYGGETTLEGALQYESLTAQASDEEPDVEVNGEDEAVIMYTSGTTGLPKGAVLTHKNIIWDSIACLTYIPPRQNDCFLLSMPMNHVSGLHTQTTTFISRGLPIVIMDQWEPEAACKLIEKHRVTIAYILVAPLLQLFDSPTIDQYDLTSLRTLMTAAAKYTPEVVTRVLYELGVDSIHFFYGLTEAAPLVTVTEFSAEMLVKPNTLGFPIWYNDVLIVDENDNPLPRGEVGEIIVRGPNVFKGYYKRPEANADVLKNGWLHTGDLAYMDEDNFLFFVDRKKDMIKTGGENVYSIEVELGIMNTSSEVKEVAVVGMPDDKWGEAVTAFAVLEPEQTLTGEELVKRARTVLGGYKLPKKVFFVDELPKNVSGKVLKRQLRDEHLEQ
ncbi:MAG: long-chain-fatty-acid--CoA ligase [Deltaproteobacteria bacterium]|nr:long-chain-fatty-acid--CoA ligase [Deltaproteobacteria bacterium]